MDGYTISEVAERTGFTTSALRFYEQVGLVGPARTPAGYRSYDDLQVERLRFVARAKGLGLTLDEIKHLVVLFDDDRCAPVQQSMRGLVEHKLAAARATAAELVAFGADLERVLGALDAHTPDGPCDDRCGCTTDPVATPAHVGDDARANLGPAPIACTLSAGAASSRVAEWREVLASAVDRHRVDGGVQIRLPRDADLPGLIRLADLEVGCCSFLAITVSVDRSGVLLTLRGPADAAPVIEALVGTDT